MKHRSVLAALALWGGCLVFTGSTLAGQIIVIGDSWAEPIGNELRTVAAENGRQDIEISTTPYWGGPRNLDSPEGRQAISGWLSQWPDATAIYMQMGQNNWLCCWNTAMIGTQEEIDLFASIIEHMDNVIEFILSIRPGITLWWTTGEYYRPHFLGTPPQLNANHDRLADLAVELAQAHPKLNFLYWNGLFQVHYGFDGEAHTIYDPDFVIPPGDISFPDPALPSPFDAYRFNKPVRPRGSAYKLMAKTVFHAITSSLPFEESIEMDAGMNGNWWNGSERNGEGVQIEVASGGDGTLVLVATIYSYDPMGKQIFLVAIGTVNRDSADVDIFITSGGQWGDNFDATQVSETHWGTGRFTARGCGQIQMTLTPNAAHQSLGYSPLEYELARLTTPLLPCPAGQAN